MLYVDPVPTARGWASEFRRIPVSRIRGNANLDRENPAESKEEWTWKPQKRRWKQQMASE